MMTKIYNKVKAGALFMLLSLTAMLFTACSPDEFEGADINGIPTMSGVDFDITVDQETNQMIASYVAQPGTYPIWILDGTTYSTPLLNFVDKSFNFTYQEFDRIEWQQNTFTTNLTAMLAYYCYLIIGHDQDSFQRLGGTPFFEACSEIVNVCQSASMDQSEQKGWLAFDSNRNRYALISNLLDESFKKYRNYYYEYHRLGLDEMSANVTNGRARIAEGMPVLKEAYRARPATYVINTFLDAKSQELVDIFRKGTDKEKKTVYEILTDIDPTRSTTYDQINN